MAILRMMVLVAVSLVAALILIRGRWESRLRDGNITWILDLDRAPIWNPPNAPSYNRFHKTFDDLPEKSAPGLTITRVLKWDWMLFDFLLYLWGVTVAFGLVYLLVRKERRDPVLHACLSVGAAMTTSAGICFGIWLLLGGWGPPAPEFFGLLGVIAGMLVAGLTFRRGAAEPGAAADRPRE